MPFLRVEKWAISQSLVLGREMPQLSSEAKHHILLEYAPHDQTRSFAALARRHNIDGGRRVLQYWYSQWNGTAASLNRKLGSGRARILSRAQVQQQVAKPILAANRGHRAISYTQLLPQVRDQTGENISLRTLQRYGKEDAGARSKTTTKRIEAECKCDAATMMRVDRSLCLH